MLENLDSIEWGKLRHAYGSASDVPQLLRDLLSPDWDVRGLALRILHESIWHQGSVYEATSYTVPFLVEMLQSPETPNQVDVAFLLAGLTQCTADVRTIVADKDQWFVATRVALRPHLEVLFPFLKYSSPAVRTWVARTFVFYPERAEDTLPLLERALESEKGKYARADMETVISILRRGFEPRWYFVTHFDPRTTSEHAYEVQLLDEAGRAAHFAAFSDPHMVILMDGQTVPMDVMWAATRQEEGQGNYVNDRGETTDFMGKVKET